MTKEDIEFAEKRDQFYKERGGDEIISDTKEPNFFNDFKRVQESIGALAKTGSNPHFKSSYVKLPALLEAIKPILNDNNFILTQIIGSSPDGAMMLETTITHCTFPEVSTAKLSSAMILGKDGQDPQKLGGKITYYRRYMLTSMFGVHEKDDDGNASAADFKKIAKEKALILGWLKKMYESDPKAAAEYLEGMTGVRTVEALSDEMVGRLLVTVGNDYDAMKKEDK